MSPTSRAPPARLALAGLAALAALSAAGCTSDPPSLCQTDLQCPSGFRCDPLTGRCGCQNDLSCAQAEQCNGAGFCQARLRCTVTADCPTGSYCDSQSGACIAAGSCTQDLHCPFGQVCSQAACAPGCRGAGDCLLSEVCRACPAGSGASCPVGNLCVQGQCDRQSACRFGELCQAPPGAPPIADCATTGGCVCQKDQRGPFCGSCTAQAASRQFCPGPPNNYCLIDGSVPLGQAFFCGVDCSQDQPCPNGYACRDVRIVTAQNCFPERGLSACAPPAGNPPCDPAKTHAAPDGGPGLVNDDCEAVGPPLVGAVCDPLTRRCAAQCLGTGEAGVQSFCSCLRDQDCAPDRCDSATRACVISGQPCIAGPVDECATTHRIFCVKVADARLGQVGYCRIGQNCAPAPGFTCAFLRQN
jgi:hypothetical protein